MKMIIIKYYGKLFAAVILIMLTASACSENGLREPLYKNSGASSDERVSDLLKRMTLEEKIGQIEALLGWEMYDKTGMNIVPSAKFREAIEQRHTGMFWATLRADPWTRKTLVTGLDPGMAAEGTNALQKYAIENTRLGIPLFFAEECAHGHMAIGTTVFPTSIGQASTWNTGLIREMAETVAEEARQQGAHIGYGPILDLVRDPRWSRVEETFGEDPYLISGMGEAVTEGFTGNGLKTGRSLISTLKHFTAYGVSDGGQNGGSVSIGKRELFHYHLPPFRQAIEAGAQSVMTAYNSIDGVPNTSNKWLLTDIIRKDWGFGGFIISDLGSIEGIRTTHSIAETPAEAAALAINSGLDADLGGNGFHSALLEAVNNGSVSEKTIDRALIPILRLKFEMGLFENPYVNPDEARQTVRCDKNRELAYRVALESLTLLENKKSLLPLSRDLKRIAVIGPNADNMYNQLGDYTAPQEEDKIITVLDGIRKKVSPATRVDYVKGCAIRDTIIHNIPEAVKAASASDAVILVIGGSSARDFRTEYESTGAASVRPETVSDMDNGEGYDRATLDFLGRQMELARAVIATGKPVVVVLIMGRPMNLVWLSEIAPAMINTWYPGEQGGRAIADVIFGDYNPAGRLPVSFQKSEGQIPVHYNQTAPARHGYLELDARPLYPFGYGLSYTGFSYDKLSVDVSGSKKELRVIIRCTIRNTGTMSGEEVVQLYLRDRISSVAMPLKQLKGFCRTALAAGEEKEVVFTLGPEELMLFGAEEQWVVEPGEFDIMIGASSEDIRLEGEFRIQDKYLISK